MPHKTRLVELLTGGNDQFLVQETRASASMKRSRVDGSDGTGRLPRRDMSQFLFPLEIVNSESLTWLPYNPDIRVSIHVVGGGDVDDHTPLPAHNWDDYTSSPPHNRDDPESQTHQRQNKSKSGGADLYNENHDSGDEMSVTPTTPFLTTTSRLHPYIITPQVTDEKDPGMVENPRKKENDNQRRREEKRRKKKRRKLERDRDEGEIVEDKKRNTGHSGSWNDKMKDTKRREDVNEDERKQTRRRGRVREDKQRRNKGGRPRGEKKEAGSTQDLMLGLAEALEELLSTDHHQLDHPTAAVPVGEEDPCTVWSTCRVEEALQELANLGSLPSCPCLYPADLPYHHHLYDPTHRAPFRWVGVSGERERIDVYHRGAHHCIRSHVTAASLAAQTCCYDRERNLLTRGSGAGSPTLVSPEVNFALHRQVDILPWLACRGNFLRYQTVRPPNNGQNCSINPVDNKYQQQVNMATDY
ncbi:isthmin-2-like [Homarus americanus]|nr:isthmin-2-like [Homarus americanus]